MAGDIEVSRLFCKSEYFCGQGLTRISKIRKTYPTGKSVPCGDQGGYAFSGCAREIRAERWFGKSVKAVMQNHRGLKPYSPWRFIVYWSLLVSIGGCSQKIDCDSSDVRNAVLQTIQSDRNNPLVIYAAKNSTPVKAKLDKAGSDDEKSKIVESAKETAVYSLGQRMVTISAADKKRTLECSGGISAAVDDAKASKEVNFTVQQSQDGKISVSVAPFQFTAP